MDKRSLAQVLLDLNLVSAEKLQEMENLQRTMPARALEVLLLEYNVLTEAELVKAKEILYQMSQTDLREVEIAQGLVSIIPEKLARRHVLFPLYVQDGLHLAMANPRNILALDEVRMVTGQTIIPCLAAPSQIFEFIERYYRSGQQSAHQVVQLIEADVRPGADYEVPLAIEVEQAPVIRLLNHILDRALQNRASDIHIEPGRDETVVRYRIDGVLFVMERFPETVHPPLLSRLKIMANLDITQHFTPQDGSISYVYNQKTCDLRVSIMPTIYGEKAVIRILHQQSQVLSLTEIGFSSEDLSHYLHLLQQSHGIILVTGPTGSGKSTTLSSSIKTLISPTINISTVEDPVEYKMDQVNQIQVNEKTGLTFARALRSLLRQDPDVLMIGEIRDEETANIAIRAALTGHLVLSTLHTNDAVGTISRLRNMDIPAYLIASSLVGVVAQRLLRRICPECREQVAITSEEEKALLYKGKTLPDQAFRGSGCAKCNGTGYHGRIGVFELLAIDEEISEYINNHLPAAVFYQYQQSRGQTLWKDAERKVANGLTSVSEVIRVIT